MGSPGGDSDGVNFPSFLLFLNSVGVFALLFDVMWVCWMEG